MSFLEKVKAVFIVPEEGKQSKGSDSTESRAIEETIAVSEQIENPAAPEDLSKFVKILSDALEKHNEPGFDYLEFRKALLSIQKLQNMDESSHYKSAYAAAHAMNVSEEKLTSTAKKYLHVLELELNNFQQTAKDYLSKQQANSDSESKRLESSIKEKEELVAKLQTELGEHREQLQQVQASLTQVTSKVESNRIGFMKVYQQLVDQIQLDIQNMDKYLK
ncbi:MAG: hypothetical protein IPM92_03790 [Saprospiraceae bacterium]|nr:hypothetical protein [Saprospiraceae bacterium]